jgi:ribose transport system substrate-binding protein
VRAAALLVAAGLAATGLTACSSNSNSSGGAANSTTSSAAAPASSTGGGATSSAASSATGAASGSATGSASGSATGSAPQSATSAASGGATGKTFRVIFVAALLNDSFFVTIRCGAQDQAKSMGMDFKFEGPTTNDVSSEIKAFNAAAATNPDGMVIAPFSNTGFGPSVRSLMSAGVPVVASGQALEPADAMTTVITNYLKSAEQLAPEIGQLTGGTGTLGIIADTTGNKTDSDRYTQLVPELQKSYPNLKILSPQYAQNSTATASTVAAAMIQGNPDLKVLYATSGPEAVGVASAIKAAGVGDKVKLVSFDSSPQQIELLKSNQLAATVGQSPYNGGALSVKAVGDYLQQHGAHAGQVPPSAGTTDLPTMLLTPQNVNTPEAQKFAYMTKCAGD